MGDTGILIGIMVYFIAFGSLQAMTDGVQFHWKPPGSGVTQNDADSDTIETHQGWVENLIECTVSVALAGLTAIKDVFTQTNTLDRINGECQRETQSQTWAKVNSFWEGFTDAVGAVVGAFNFMMAALRVFWDLITLNIPGPVLLNMFLVWPAAGTMGFLIYRQVRGVGG